MSTSISNSVMLTSSVTKIGSAFLSLSDTVNSVYVLALVSGSFLT